MLQRTRLLREQKLELIIGLMIILIVSSFAITFDFFEELNAFTRLHESWELDEILTIFIAVLIAGTVLAVRHISILQKLANDLEDANTNIATQELMRHRQDKMAALGELSGGMAHEISNALQPALGLGELVERGLEKSGNQQHLEYMRLIISSAVHAQAIVENVLDFTREKDLELTRLPAVETLYETLSFSKAIMPTTIEFQFSKPEDVSSQQWFIECNKTSLIQIFVNLLKNAANAMNDEGTISIVIGQTSLPGCPDTSAIAIDITDRGCGMSAETIEKVFDPFFTTKDASEGTGLGLAAVYGLVQSHDGQIEVKSTVGLGSTFTVYFPVSERSEQT